MFSERMLSFKLKVDVDLLRYKQGIDAWLENTRGSQQKRKIYIHTFTDCRPWWNPTPGLRYQQHAGAMILNVAKADNKITSAIYVEPHDTESPVNIPLNQVATTIADICGLDSLPTETPPVRCWKLRALQLCTSSGHDHQWNRVQDH